MATNDTREQREARIEASIAGFLRGWFGASAGFITASEMLDYVNSTDTHDLQFIHSLLCKLHNLMLSQQLYNGDVNSDVGNH